jgi:hypothetical protein
MPMMWENKRRIQHIPHRPPNGSIPAEKIDNGNEKKVFFYSGNHYVILCQDYKGWLPGFSLYCWTDSCEIEMINLYKRESCTAAA